MHLKFGYFVLYTPIYRLKERKPRCFHLQNCPCVTVGAKVVLCARAPRALQASLSIMKIIKYGDNKPNRRRSSVFMHKKLQV